MARVLYRLPELQGKTTAYVVEGEKDADRLWSIGLPATTGAGGAGKWRPEYVQQLKAASIEQVVVFPDNDDAGRQHAEDVARSCHDAGIKVKVVTLPDLPVKGDVSDYLTTHTKEDLIAMVKATPTYGATTSSESEVKSDTHKPSLFTTAAETCRQREKTAMVLEPYLAAGSIASLIAKIKLGKTSTVLEMTRCLRQRQGFCGFPAPTKSYRVLYATEQPQASFAKQLEDAGLQTDEGVIVTYLSRWRGMPWSQIAPAIIEHAITERVDVIVVDTASRWFGFKGDEENQAGASANVDLLMPFTEQGGTVILPRHGRKSGGSASDAGRGSSSIDGAVDVILHLHKPSGQPADVREIEYVGRFDMPERVQIRRLANFGTLTPSEFDDVKVVSPGKSSSLRRQRMTAPMPVSELP